MPADIAARLAELSTPGSARTRQRLAMGAAAVLPIALAADLLPASDRDSEKWLRARGLVRDLAGREVVVWADVLDALRGNVPEEPAKPPRPVVARVHLAPPKPVKRRAS